MAKRRKFTSEFKTELVLEVLSGTTSQAELCRHHHLNEDQLSKWKQQFLEKAPSLFDTTDKPSSEMQKRVDPLEQLVGRMDMLKDSSAPSKRKKSTSMSIKASPRRGIASVSLSHTCITTNALTRR